MVIRPWDRWDSSRRTRDGTDEEGGAGDGCGGDGHHGHVAPDVVSKRQVILHYTVQSWEINFRVLLLSLKFVLRGGGGEESH